jgi:hypothetical protein
LDKKRAANAALEVKQGEFRRTLYEKNQLSPKFGVTSVSLKRLNNG